MRRSRACRRRARRRTRRRRCPAHPPLPRRPRPAPQATPPADPGRASARRRNARPLEERRRAGTPLRPPPPALPPRRSRRATAAPRAGSSPDRSGARAARPWRPPRRRWHSVSTRAPQPRAGSPPHATGGPPRAGTRRARPPCAPPGLRPAWERRPGGRTRPKPASRRPPHSREHRLKFRARQRRQTEAAEAGLILEEEGDAETVVRPADRARARARDVRAEVVDLVRLAQRDVHFPTISQPAGLAGLLEPLVRYLDAAEILVERLVLRRDGYGVRRLEGFAPHARAALVQHLHGGARSGGEAVPFHVEARRVGAVRQCAAGVHEELGQRREGRAPRASVDRDRSGDAAAAEPWDRVHALRP